MSKRKLRSKVRRLRREKLALLRELFCLQKFCNQLIERKGVS